MRVSHPLAIPLSALLLAVAYAPVLPQPTADPDPLSPAAEAVTRGQLLRGLELLRELFESGYGTPAAVYADPRFAALREDAEARSAWRNLMREHVRESDIVMVTPGEAGTPMLIRGRVVRAPDGQPIPNALLELYHTDDTGHYEPGKSVGRDARSRLFCFVQSDGDGRFEVRTIKPAPYPGASEGAAHVHYRIRAEGYRSYAHDFRPYDHPRDPGQRASAVERGERISTVRRQDDGSLVCEVVIPMRTVP